MLSVVSLVFLSAGEVFLDVLVHLLRAALVGDLGHLGTLARVFSMIS